MNNVATFPAQASPIRDFAVVDSPANIYHNSKAYKEAMTDLTFHESLVFRSIEKNKDDADYLQSYGNAIIDRLYIINKVAFSDIYALERILDILNKTSKNSTLFTRLKKIKNSSYEGEYNFFIEGFGDFLIKPQELVSLVCEYLVEGHIKKDLPISMLQKRTILNYNSSIRLKVNFRSPKTIADSLMALQQFLVLVDRY